MWFQFAKVEIVNVSYLTKVLSIVFFVFFLLFKSLYFK